jgi:hypothetical protein
MKLSETLYSTMVHALSPIISTPLGDLFSFSQPNKKSIKTRSIAFKIGLHGFTRLKSVLLLITYYPNVDMSFTVMIIVKFGRLCRA